MPGRAPRSAALVPALLTTIAYVDPGNFGTNIAAGSSHGFTLVWVVVLSCAAAALVQYLAAKLGAGTGSGLADHVAQRLPRPLRLLAWAQAQLAIVMTDLAEIVGGALGLKLLFGIPLPVGGVVIGVVAFTTLGLRGQRYRPVALLALATVAATVTATAVGVGPDWRSLGPGLVPSTLEHSQVVLATGIVGATVMPHALYFHSAASTNGSFGRQEARAHLRRHLASIAAAMTLAGSVNLLILVIGTTLPAGVDTIGGAHAALAAPGPFGRPTLALLLGVALLASGLASSLIGAWTGESVMDGFLRVRVPAWVRRLVAILPAVLVLLVGVDADSALVYSQVVLGFALPLTLAPLVWLTGRRDVMGDLRSGRALTVAAALITATVTALDLAVLLGVAA